MNLLLKVEQMLMRVEAEDTMS